MAKKKLITDILPEIKEHVVMRDYTTLRVGGVADYFYEVKTIDELIRAVRTAVKLKVPYFILGNGSNVIFSDYGFPGLIIKNSTKNISFLKEKSQAIVDSGVKLAKLITESVTIDLAGLDFLYGVPGTVGGAVYGNAGAWGYSIGDYVKAVTLLQIDPKDEIPKIVQFDSSWLEFGYRTSKLKEIKSRHKPVILAVKFQLAQNQKEELMRKLKEFQEKRQKAQPVGSSAGSIFRNPIPKELINITGSGTRGMPVLPPERTAGYMLDQAGVKGLKQGSAEVSHRHANFIINKNGANATDIRSLIEAMRERVKQKFEVTLEEEIEYVGQW